MAAKKMKATAKRKTVKKKGTPYAPPACKPGKATKKKK